MDVHELVDRVVGFGERRDWGQFHSVRNLMLALAGEVGELAETVQWVPDAAAQAYESARRAH